MKILQLCRKFPYPLKDGESVAVTYLASAYRDQGAELTLLSFNTIKHYQDPNGLPSDYDHYQKIHTVFLDNRPKPFSAFLNLFSKKSYHISRFTTRPFKMQLLEILQNNAFDVVQLESVYFAPYIPIIRQYSGALVVMRAHNVAFEIWERMTEQTDFFLKKGYLYYLSRKLKRFEIENLKNYDLLLAISPKDLKKFKELGFSGQALVAPVGLDFSRYPAAQLSPTKTSLSFIGSLDWMPNQEGLKWFLEEVWVKLRYQYPWLQFHIAGRNTPDWVFDQAGNGVVVLGEIEDAVVFQMQHTITVVPLFSGSGMRVKILEGMALGRVVISTSIGLEGIDATSGKEVLIADSAVEFFEKICVSIENPEKNKELGARARHFVQKNYDFQSIARNVLSKIKSCIK